MNEMTPETLREQAQPGTMRPEQIEGLRPENPYASFADYNRACLIATIFALAEALRAVVLWGEAYMALDLFEGDEEEKKYARRLVRRAGEAGEALNKVSEWLPDNTRWGNYADPSD